MNDDKAKELHAAEIARQLHPDKKCGRVIGHRKDGTPEYCPQIVKLGTLCPACGIKVE